MDVKSLLESLGDSKKSIENMQENFAFLNDKIVNPTSYKYQNKGTPILKNIVMRTAKNRQFYIDLREKIANYYIDIFNLDLDFLITNKKILLESLNDGKANKYYFDRDINDEFAIEYSKTLSNIDSMNISLTALGFEDTDKQINKMREKNKKTLTLGDALKKKRLEDFYENQKRLIVLYKHFVDEQTFLYTTPLEFSFDRAMNIDLKNIKLKENIVQNTFTYEYENYIPLKTSLSYIKYAINIAVVNNVLERKTDNEGKTLITAFEKEQILKYETILDKNISLLNNIKTIGLDNIEERNPITSYDTLRVTSAKILDYLLSDKVSLQEVTDYINYSSINALLYTEIPDNIKDKIIYSVFAPNIVELHNNCQNDEELKQYSNLVTSNSTLLQQALANNDVCFYPKNERVIKNAYDMLNLYMASTAEPESEIEITQK